MYSSADVEKAVPNKKGNKINDLEIFTIVNFFKSLSFKPIICPSFNEHDKWMSYISHGTYILSTLIPSLLKNYDYTMLSHIVAGGFKDTTRCCNSPVEWGESVLLNNPHIISLIDSLESELSYIKKIVKNNDVKKLRTWLSEAKNTRSSIID